MIHKFTLCFLMGVGLLFSACIKNGNISSEMDVTSDAFIKNRCIRDQFAEGQDTNLYGIECIEGKSLVIKTLAEDKSPEKTSASKNLKSETDFINEIYKLKYELLKNKGDNNEYLRDLLPSGEKAKDFFGSQSKEYNIDFKIRGNYLILFKRSKNLEDIPYTERTSMEITENGEYMVPFLGYKIKYCNAKIRENSQGEATRESVSICEGVDANKAKYIYLSRDNIEAFQFKNKQDLLPSNYLEGKWFVTYGAVESSDGENEIAPTKAYLIEFTKNEGSLEGKDSSGDIQDSNRRTIIKLPVQWVDFELDKNGQQFQRFAERDIPNQKFEDKSYLQVDFSKEIEHLQEGGRQSKWLTTKTSNIQDLLVAKDYFSFLVRTTTIESGVAKSEKYRFSFRKNDSVDSKDFFERRLFIETFNRRFGALFITPQSIKKLGENSQDDEIKNYRWMHFNTSKEVNIIKWYFSKNTPKEESYRAIAREAVDVWNTAFQIITKGSKKTIELKLIEDEDKDLGDLRYNIINLIQAEDQQKSNLYGIAPSYVNPNTGQIIATTSNVLIPTSEKENAEKIQNYIRDQIFQKNQTQIKIIKDEEKNTEVISPYIKSQIIKHCGGDIKAFIDTKREQREAGTLIPDQALKDNKLTVVCAKKVARKQILATLVHEMGHSFGLGHNFKASTDKNNYYKDQDDVKKYFPNIKFGTNFHAELISQTSSVMDYTPSNQAQLTYPGKYDLAALRYLYRYQVEDKNGDFIELGSKNPSPAEQSENKETLKNKKEYLHCSDLILDSDLLCKQRDYGSTPKEIVQHHISNLMFNINANRYLYDEANYFLISSSSYESINQVLSFYKKWFEFRDSSFEKKYIETKYDISREEEVSQYTTSLKEKIESRNSESDYVLYSELRTVVYDFLTEILLEESMRCHVINEKNEQHIINFEMIRNQLYREAKNFSDQKDFYAENCYSKDVRNFLDKNKLTLEGQSGAENYESETYGRVELANKKNLIGPISIWKKVILTGILLSNQRRLPVLKDGKVNILQNPDEAHMYRQQLEEELINPPEGHMNLDFEISKLRFWKFSLQLRTSLLGSGEGLNSLRERRRAYFESSTFKISGTGTQSFYDSVTKPLEKIAVEDITEIFGPFFNKIYEEFKEQEKNGKYADFKTYIVKVKKSEILLSQGKMIIPWQSNNFPAKVFAKYNGNSKKIAKLEKQDKLTFLEETILENLKNHNEILYSLK